MEKYKLYAWDSDNGLIFKETKSGKYIMFNKNDDSTTIFIAVEDTYTLGELKREGEVEQIETPYF
jgi:hypothetical protein